MADFSYLDSTGIGQIDTPFQAPKTLEVPTISPQMIGQPVDFANLYKQQKQDTGPTPLFNDSLDMNQFKKKTAPRSFDADRLVPYKQSGAFKDLGYNPDMPEDKIQAQYDYDQSNWEATKSSLGDLMHVTGQAFTNYFKSYGDTVKSLVDINQQGTMYNDLIPQVESDNERARTNLRFKGDVPMHWYNYLPIPGLMKGDVAEELLPQLGFTLGTGAAAIIENLGVSLLTAGGGEPEEAVNTASKLYKLIGEFTTLGKGAEIAKSLYKGPVEGLRAGLDAWRLTNATLNETSLEGATNYVQHKQKLVDDYIAKNGHAPAIGSEDMGKIEQSAHNVANETMWGEFPVLFASNWIQYRNLLAPTLAKKLAENEALRGMRIVNKADDAITSQFGVEEAGHATTAWQKLGHGAGHFLKNATTEGLEESGQRLVSTSSSDYQQKLYNGKNSNLLDSYLSVGVPDILSDSGLQEFMGGFVTGSIFHSFGMAGNKLATLGKVMDADGNLSYKTNLLTKLGFGTEEIAQAKVKNNLQSIADILNTEDLKSIFKEEGLANMIKSTQDSQAMNAALHENDLFNIGNLKSNALVRFLHTGLETGKLDLRLTQLNAFRDLPQDKLNEFLGMDTGALNKQTTGAVIDHIIDKANQVKEIFDQEKNRFKSKEQSALAAFRSQDASHTSLEQELRTKHGIDANETDLRAPLLQKAEQGSEEAKDDLVTYHDSMVNRNKAFMNYVTVKEGRKAAVFAAANMDIDSERSNEMMNALKDHNLSYLGVDKALTVKDLDAQIKDLEDTAKAAQGIDNELMLSTDKKLKAATTLRNALARFYGDDENQPYKKIRDVASTHLATNTLYNYMNVDSEMTPQKQRLREKEKNALGYLLKLEGKNKDNLSLYNRLTQSDKDFDEYSKQETQKTTQTIAKWWQEFINQNKDKEAPDVHQAEQSDEQQSIAEVVAPEEQEHPQQSLIDAQFDHVKKKVANGEVLTPQEEQFLMTGTAISKDVADFANKYFDAKAEQQATEEQPIEEPVQEVLYRSDRQGTMLPGEYISEPNKGVKEDELAETSRLQEHNGQVVPNPNRTIVNEISKEEFSKVTPKLEGGYTAWKQRFLDYIGNNDFLSRFSGKLEIDSADNYPEGSREYAYLKANPTAAGVVLIITDKKGNDRFGSNYYPGTKGDKMVHSLPNSVAKTNLKGTMKVGDSIPVDLASLSQGIFDELENPRSTSKLVEGISKADYQYIIAKGPAEETIYYVNGMALRNGGLYIRTNDSYIKLLPDYIGNVAPNITNLIGTAFNTYNEALEVARFLQRMVYTNREKGGIVFSIVRSGAQFVINSSMIQVGKSVNLTAQEIGGVIKAQRMNIDSGSIGTDAKFYDLDAAGNLVTTTVKYNDFLETSTLTNKKAYETAEGKKVLKSVNRYLTLGRSLEDIYNERKTPEVAKESPKVERTTEEKEFLYGKSYVAAIADIEAKMEANERARQKALSAINSALGTQDDIDRINRRYDSLRQTNLEDLQKLKQEPIQEPIKSKRRKFDEGEDKGFGDIDKLFSRKTEEEESIMPMQAEKDWINQTFKQPDLAITKRIIDAGAWGTWTQSGITLLNNAPQGTGYHEAWHHFSQLYLTVPQKNGLYNEVREKVSTLKGATNIQVEEHLANDFRNYVISGGTQILGNAPQRNTLFRRILDFLKRLFTGRESLDRLYKNLYEGNLTRYKPSAGNAIFGKLNSKLTDKSGNELMNNQQSFRILNHLESIAGQVLSQGNISPAQFMTGDRDISLKRAKELAGQMRSALVRQVNSLDEEITEFETKYPNASTPLVETWENLSKVLDNFGTVFIQYYKQSGYNSHALSTLDLEAVDTDIEDQEKSEASFGGKGWDVSGSEESVLDSASAETKALIKGLSKVQIDKDGNPVKVGGKVQLFRNEYGLNEPVHFIRTVNNIANLLEGSFSYEEMLNKIKDTGNQKRFPELALLQERLPDFTKPMKYTEVKQLASFLKNFSKTYVPVYTLVKLLSGEFLFREETRRSQDLIEKEWGNSFTTIPKDSPYVKNSIVQFDDNDKPYINPRAQLDFNLQTPEGRKDLLGFLGIQISQRAEATKKYEQNVTAEKLGFLLQSLRKRLAAGQKISNPVGDLKREYRNENTSIFSEKTTINALTALEAQFTDTNPSMAFRNAEGNMQHGLSENNWITNNNYFLSRTDNYSQIVENPSVQHLNIANNPYIEHSLFLNKLFNLDPNSSTYGQRRKINGEPVTLTFGNYNGYDREVEGKNNEGTSTTKLSPRDKMIMDINSLLIGGAVEIMRTESSSSAFFVKLSDYASTEGKVQNLPFLPNEIGGDASIEKVLDYFRGAFQDEVATIANVFNSLLPEYKKNIGRFTMFDDILTKGTKDSIMEDLKELRDDLKMSPEEKQYVVDDIYIQHRNVIDTEVAEFLRNQVRDFLALLKERNVGINDMSKTLTQKGINDRGLSLVEIATTFVVNDFVLNSEFAKLFDGNVGFFKAYHKRAKGNTSTGTRAFSDGFLKGYLQGTLQNTLAGSLGISNEVNLNETKTLVYKDDNRTSVYTKDRNSLYKRALKALNGGVDDEEAYKMMDSKYNAMNVADGQGNSTLDFYREIRMRVANWSFADEVQFNKEVIGFRERKGLYDQLGEEQIKRDQQFLKDYKDVSSTFPPMKMQYNGALKMPGTFAPILDKFSIAPLIPSVISGTVWDDRNDKLLKEGIGYTKFESGTKKYKYTPQDFYKATDGFTSELAPIDKPYDSATHFAEGLKEQLRTSSEPKDEATWGTQMRKLFLANLFNSGMAEQQFRQVLNNYIDLLNRVEDQQKKNLYKEFGITEDGNNLVIRDVKNFVKTLQRQVDTRALNDNIKNFIQYDTNTKSFVYPLEVSLNKVQVQDLISGMIFNRLTRLKVNGDMLIQVASSGFENPNFKYTNATEEDNIKYGSNGLPFYEPTFNADGTLGVTKAMRVKVALIKEWTKLLNTTHMDGKKMGTLERLNEALRDDKWREENRRKITMIGYRIPTQGANSMEFMEIHEFLPPVAGSIVILPAEIVAKAGSDYDIDKLPIIRPSLTDDGELADEAPEVYEKQMEKIRAKLKDLFTKEKDINSVRRDHDYSDVDRVMDKIAFGYDAEDIENEIDGLILDNDEIAELLDKYMRVASNRQGALTNKAIDLYKEVLSSPQMFKQLILPNNVDLMKPIAQDIAKMVGLAGFDKDGETKEFTNTDVLKYRSNNVKFEQLLSGKRDVSIFAKANVQSQLLQQAGMTVNPKYTFFYTNRAGETFAFNRAYNLLLLSPEDRQGLKTTKASPDGSLSEVIDYSSNKDVTGVYKQDYFSQLINATVDVAGDPWYMGLRLNDRVKGALVHMINQGIPARKAIMFLNHPTIQRYTNAVMLLGNIEKWNLASQVLTGNPRGKALKMLGLIEKIDNAHKEDFYFKEAELESHIKDPSLVSEWFGRKVLAHYLKLEEQGSALRDSAGIMSFDTTKYLTPISAQNNLDLREKVKRVGLFDWDATQKVLTHSMISPFNNLDKTIDIFEKIMPIGMSKQIIEASAQVMRDFQGDFNTRMKLERTLNNDWIEFIIKNYGRIGSMNFEDYAKDLIIFNGGNEVLAQKLTDMKNTMPALNYFDAFRRLYNNTSEKAKGWRNIELQRGLDNSSDYQNVLIEELTQLSNFTGTEVPGAKFTPAQVLEIRNFFTKLSYLAFQQSGFNKSNLYFTDVIPSENLVPIFREALNNFQSVVKANPQALSEIINAFVDKFKQQNPTFGMSSDKSYREAWRGKMYKIGDDTPDAGDSNPDYGEGGPSENNIDDMLNKCQPE